jgi:predicted ATP-grasp superfamily ATP-dependent carboligase
MRVYGALMWSIGKVIKTPEVLRVYVGSFWDQPLVYEDNAALFEMEERDLMGDLRDLPRNNVIRKINELVKRVRIAKVNGYLVSHLREQMPMLMGHQKKQKQVSRLTVYSTSHLLMSSFYSSLLKCRLFFAL